MNPQQIKIQELGNLKALGLGILEKYVG